MPDRSRPGALFWLVNNPPRHFPPPDGWAWCEPDDKSRPWHLFKIGMGKGEEDDICETLRDAEMCDLSRIGIDDMRCHNCNELQFYDVDSPWELYVCGGESVINTRAGKGEG